MTIFESGAYSSEPMGSHVRILLPSVVESSRGTGRNEEMPWDLKCLIAAIAQRVQVGHFVDSARKGKRGA